MQRRVFLKFGLYAVGMLPVLGCGTTNVETDVKWFLSDKEILAVGRAYHQKSFRLLNKNTLIINGWIITREEAEACKKSYLERA